MRNNKLEDIVNRLKAARSVAIFCHTNPDGDAIGSTLSLSLALKQLGKDTQVVCGDYIPPKLSFIEETAEISRKLPDADYDLFVACDCSDAKRTGEFDKIFSRTKYSTLVIDHHISNSYFGKLNYVADCSSTCEIIFGIIEALDVTITPQIATLLLLGITTDTNCFMNCDVTSETFSIAARLVEYGADRNRINFNVYQNQPQGRLKLFSTAISNIRYALEGKLAILTVTEQMLASSGVDKSYTDGFVDYPRSISGVEVSISLLEVKKGQYKISFRSKGNVDVSAVAASFGGGGHKWASGCMLFGEYEEVIERLTYAVYQHL